MVVQGLGNRLDQKNSSAIQQRSQVHSGSNGLFHQVGRGDPIENGDILEHD